MKKCIFVLAIVAGMLNACKSSEDVEIVDSILKPNQVVNLLEKVVGKSQTEATNILNDAGLDMCDFVGFEGIYMTFGKGETEDEWYRKGVIDISVEADIIVSATYFHANQKRDICAEEVKALLKIVGPIHTFGTSTFTFQGVDYWNDSQVDFWKAGCCDNVTTSYVWSDVQGAVNNYNGISINYKFSRDNLHSDDMTLGMSTDNNIIGEKIFDSNGYTCVLDISCY